MNASGDQTRQVNLIVDRYQLETCCSRKERKNLPNESHIEAVLKNVLMIMVPNSVPSEVNKKFKVAETTYSSAGVSGIGRFSH